MRQSPAPHGTDDGRAGRRERQAGVAAIELSLTLLILMMLFFAIAGFGTLFWAGQSLAGVAADTARHALRISYDDTTGWSDTALIQAVRGHACQAADATPILAAFGAGGSCQTGTFATAAIAPCPDSPGRRCLTLDLTLHTDAWPFINTMRRLAGILTSAPENWIPAALKTRAVVLIAQPLSGESP